MTVKPSTKPVNLDNADFSVMTDRQGVLHAAVMHATPDLNTPAGRKVAYRFVKRLAQLVAYYEQLDITAAARKIT